MSLFGVRLLSFILEELVDYSIDRELESDLINQELCPMPWQNILKSAVEYIWGVKIYKKEPMPAIVGEYEFVGSVTLQIVLTIFLNMSISVSYFDKIIHEIFFFF